MLCIYPPKYIQDRNHVNQASLFFQSGITLEFTLEHAELNTFGPENLFNTAGY